MSGSLRIAFIMWLAVSWSTESLTFNKNEISKSRRHFFDTTVPASFGLVLLSNPSTSHAASSSDPAENLRQTASKLPGYGPADVYYPPSFEGTWIMKRQNNTGLDISCPLRAEYTRQCICSRSRLQPGQFGERYHSRICPNDGLESKQPKRHAHGLYRRPDQGH